MRELRLVLEASEQIAAQGEEGVLATVVKVAGSTYRRPGARLLITGRGGSVGGVSGGCLEGDLLRKAWWRTADGPTVVTYDSTADDDTAWHFGLGCNGVVHVLLERIVPGVADPLAFVRDCLARNECGVLATVFRADAATGVAVGERLALTATGRTEHDLGSGELAERIRAESAESLDRDRSRNATYELPTGEVDVFHEVIRPPLRLVIFGGGFDAVPLVHAAKAVGWHVTVVDPRPVLAVRSAAADEFISASPQEACERLRPDARTAAVVMNHNFPRDRDTLRALLATPPRYIGVLGPRNRTQQILAELGEPDAADLACLHAPIGLDIGADAPEEIAAAIVAQVVAVFAGHAGGHLRERAGPIHRREAVRETEAVS